jgi:hypothetical protein
MAGLAPQYSVSPRHAMLKGQGTAAEAEAGMFGRIAWGLLVALAVAAAGPLMAQERESVRVATFNAYLLSPIFKCGNPQFADCLLQIGGQTKKQAGRLADAILKDPGRFDIIAINEAWDEDAKALLIDRLRIRYPNYVGKLDADLIKFRGGSLKAALLDLGADVVTGVYGSPINKINGEDSGLMLFASSAFSFLPLPNPAFKWGFKDGETLKATSENVGFRLFDTCGGLDCLSAKGVAIVRLAHASGRNYTIVFSHMQADYFDKTPPQVNAGARQIQFDRAQELIETTLSTLTPAQRKRERVLMMGDLNVPLFHPPSAEWAGRFARAGSYWTDKLYDAWARTNSPADPGITNYIDAERYDYILAAPAPYTVGSGPDAPVCVQHMTIPTDFQDLESDHNMVVADLNLGYFFCHPQIAYPVTLEKATVPDGDPPLEQQYINIIDGIDKTQIRYAGAMQWFHVVRRDAGTYSIGPNRQDLDMDIYLPGNLTTPISRYYEHTRAIVVDENRMFVQTFALPREFYIRIAARDPNFTGTYSLLVRRNSCDSKEEACLLQPGEPPQSATFNAAGSLLGTQKEAWYAFDVVGQTDSGADQTVKLTASGVPDRDTYKVELEGFSDPHGGPPPLVKNGTTYTAEGPMGAGATGYLVIRQTAQSPFDITVAAAMETTVRNLELKALICEDETNPEFGSDDIYTQLTLDGVTTRYPLGGELEYDCDDSAAQKNWPGDFGYPSSVTFAGQARMKVVEADSSKDDPSLVGTFPDLAPGVAVIDGFTRPLLWRFDGGRYRLNYELRLRRNEPVKAGP